MRCACSSLFSPCAILLVVVNGGKCYDEDVIPLLEQNLGTYVSGNRFVVLHLGGGSHGPLYSDRYPPEFQLLKPMCNDADATNQCNRRKSR